MKNQIVNYDNLFDFPNNIQKIFEKLNSVGAKAIIVGGCVRDKLLGKNDIKDFDIEVYHIESYKKLTTVLKEFGDVNFVGKSFGVLKLRTKEAEFDFSLPRKENKISKGHKGFKIKTDPSLTFKEASKRRDFTINAIGYDVIEKKLLDYYQGLEHLDKKILKHIDKNSFVDDPLRILRGVVFASRFKLNIDKELEKLLIRMIKEKLLLELPKERVYEELKKLFLKSDKPSIAFKLLKKYKEEFFFKELFKLDKEHLKHILNSIDNLANSNIKDLSLYFAVMSFYISDYENFIKKFTEEKKLLKEVENLLKNYNYILELKSDFSDFDIKLLSTKTNISKTILFLKALYPDKNEFLDKVYDKAKKLDVLTSPPKPLINGDDLIKAGLKPSKEFKKILQKLYIMQLKQTIKYDGDKTEIIKKATKSLI